MSYRLKLLSLPLRGAWIEITMDLQAFINSKSLPLRGAWIEIPCTALQPITYKSLPLRGAWIEIPHYAFAPSTRRPSLPLRGRGLKYFFDVPCDIFRSRSPCGGRGLKYLPMAQKHIPTLSLPLRGAWIEICKASISTSNSGSSLPLRGAWIEIADNR